MKNVPDRKRWGKWKSDSHSEFNPENMCRMSTDNGQENLGESVNTEN